MSRRKVILPSWAVSSETSKDIAALNEHFPDLSKGELIINTKKENVSLTTLNESGETARFIDESKTIELVDSALTNAKDYADSTVAEHDSTVTEVLKTYSTTSQIEEMVGAASAATLADVENKGYLTEHQSLEHLQEKIKDLEDIRSGALSGSTALQEVPAGYATEKWVKDQNYLTEHQDISHLATKGEIPSLSGYATESWVEGKGYLTEHQSLSGYATETYVLNEIARAQLEGEDVDLSGFATKDDIKNLASESWVEGKGYLTEHQDISHLATKGEIPSLSGYATEVWVKEYVEETATGGEIDLSDYAKKEDIKNLATKDEIPSLEGLASEEWVKSQKYLTEHQSLSSYSTTDEVIDMISGTSEGIISWVEDKKYLTEHQDLSDYAKKSDLGVSNPITVKGGVWADIVGSVFGGTIQKGLTFEEFLKRMVYDEKWPENISWVTNLSVTGNGLTLSLNNTTNSVEVGTKLTLSNIKPYNSDNLSVKGKLTVSWFDYGYSLSIDNPELIDKNVYEIELATEKVDEAHVDTLAVKFTGFTTNSGNVVSDINTTSELSVLDLYACGTTNYIKASQNSASYKIASNNADINTEMYCASNMGSYSAITPEIEYISASTAYTKNYTISTYRNTFYGITSSSANCDSEFIRSLTATNRTIGSEKISFTVGSDTGKRFVIASPRKISRVLNTSLNQDVTAQLKETHKTISVPGANNMFPIDYNVYDNEWSIDFTTGHKWEITFE